ncbi:tigger transposable element-derived protein 4-like [Microplitis mediator]|uniref:tigger transposable element-derived protein 4-like n=1 Tax=Microplitis mediator TaxID=375433 RepID=UPI002553AB05|nr:tigger transposable element-derived protein 4-like [Microplitis mediator]
MSAKRKLTTLTLQEKFDVINTVKTGMKKKDVAAQYGIPASTLSTIIKNEAEILLRYEKSGNISYKRRRVAEFPDLEEGLLTWFKQCRDKNISVSGPVLREKAEEYSKLLGHNSFRASNGWLDYEPKDIFNADETGLFFKCLPDKTLIFKNEKCYGGKHSKERLTILLATNMTGSEKLKPLVIGKSKKPRCFSGCKSLPLDYEANTIAWMTSEIFKEWLLKIDKKMIKDKRNILLFIDNCTAHNLIPPLKAIIYGILSLGVVVGSLASYVGPINALDIIDFVEFLSSGHLPPELVEARWFFESVRYATEPFEVLLAPNHEGIKRLSVCVMEHSESLTRAETGPSSAE